jgi:hypothetical protein
MISGGAAMPQIPRRLASARYCSGGQLFNRRLRQTAQVPDEPGKLCIYRNTED